MSRIASTSSSTLGGLSKAGSPEVPIGARAPQGNGSPWPLGRTVSGMSSIDLALDPTRSSGSVDPDELFTRLSVSEARKVQQRLRLNAEAKQEELRLMVGERYRDLLQASSSIISMAASSKRVLHALDEMRDIVGSAKPPRTARRSRIGEEDNHIRALQSLSAHLKLLLDAPEHLWRFMEQGMYLKAAWLFLTARVVHRTLLQEDEDTDQSWHEYGIDVSEQIPLVQRQWDTVSQFRSQITHKATLSLREDSASSGEICATLLTLHILESRPLAETLSIFLAQRSKILATILSPLQESANGHVKIAVSEKHKPSNRARKAILREVKNNLQAALQSISYTLQAARDIFSDAPGAAGMMRQALRYIQQEKAPDSLPVELQITTQTLLNSLPSSAHFSLLPGTIRSYKPYIGAAPVSPSVAQGLLQQKLGDWFSHSLGDVQAAASKWLSNLDSVREVWDIRTSSFTVTSKLHGLESPEKARVRAMLESLCQQQTISVWRRALNAAEVSFQERLASALQSLRSNSDDSVSDAQPVDYLFHTIPLPPSSQAIVNPSLAGAPFKRYKAGLLRQLRGRTPRLHDVLDILEESSRRLEEDLGAMHASGAEEGVLVAQLRGTYQPDAASLCSRLICILDPFQDDASSMEGSQAVLAFLGRLQYELASSSSFITTIGCDSNAVNKFRNQMHTLHRKTFEHWRALVTEQIVTNVWPRAGHQDDSKLRPADHPRQPTATLVQALLSLSSSLQEFWTAIDPVRKQSLVGDSVAYFISRSCREPSKAHQLLQRYWDMRFMRQLMDVWDLPELQAQLDAQIADTRGTLLSQGLTQPDLIDDHNMSDYLSRMQVIFAPLFPPPPVHLATSPAKDQSKKPSALLCYAPPAVDQHFQPTLEVVKPSARFGLLLVGTSNAR